MTAMPHSRFLLCLGTAVLLSATVAGKSGIEESKWKLTLPTGKQKKPDTISNLTGYSNPELYYRRADGVYVFITPVNGVHTKTSHYPRTELREKMGSQDAAWSTKTGKRVLTFEASVQRMATVKQDMCVGQIHDDTDDWAQFRFRSGQAQLIYLTNQTIVVDKNYKLGRKFRVKMEVNWGTVKVYYNNMTNPVVTYPLKVDRCYFKLGSYLHTNPTWGDDPKDYGEVWVYFARIQRPWKKRVN